LIWSYKEIFNDKPGICNFAEHEIELEPGFKPKAMRPYRIPDKMKTEVVRQLLEMLKEGKIR